MFVVFLLGSFVLDIENFGTNKRGEVYLKESKIRKCGKVHQQHYTSIVLLLNSSTNTRIYNQLRTKWNKNWPSIPTNSFFLRKSSDLQPQTTGSFFRIPHLQVLRQYTKYLAFALHHKWSTWNLPDFHSPVLRVPKTTPRTRRRRRNRRWRLHHPRSVARDLASIYGLGRIYREKTGGVRSDHFFTFWGTRCNKQYILEVVTPTSQFLSIRNPQFGMMKRLPMF